MCCPTELTGSVATSVPRIHTHPETVQLVISRDQDSMHVNEPCSGDRMAHVLRQLRRCLCTLQAPAGSRWASADDNLIIIHQHLEATLSMILHASPYEMSETKSLIDGACLACIKVPLTVCVCAPVPARRRHRQLSEYLRDDPDIPPSSCSLTLRIETLARWRKSRLESGPTSGAISDLQGFRLLEQRHEHPTERWIER